VKLTTHLHLVQRLRIRGAVPPLTHTTSWHGVQLSTQTNVTLPVPLPLLLPVLILNREGVEYRRTKKIA
jgi:hypothetical protein